MKISNFNLNEQILIVAELSANHNGSLEVAKRTIQAAKRAGANAIKLQTYSANSLTLDSKNDDFMIKAGLWKNQSLYELYKNASMPYEWHKELFKTAFDEGLICFSSPFSKFDLDFLDQFSPPAYKIASFEVSDYELVSMVAKKQKPILISLGIATEDEIYDLIQICQNAQNSDIILLKCTSSYPASLEDANLKTIPYLKEKFGVNVGFSDHTLGDLAPVVAVSLGACVIEKHFVLDKSIKSADSAFSLDENEFKIMVKNIRDTEKLLGKKSLKLNENSLKNRQFARSLYASKDIKKGEIFTNENIKSVRPFHGLHPKYKNEILGKKAKKDFKFADRIEK